MSVFTLKTLAILFMLLDHIGLFFFPDVLLLRFIGRLAFPFFGWLIVNGALHTKNVKQYFLRLLLFGILSQIPYLMVFRLYDPSFWDLNIFFTLAAGLLAIVVLRSRILLPTRLLLVGAILLAASLFSFEYGAGGVLSMIAFYYTRTNWRVMLITQLLIFFSFFTLPALITPSFPTNYVMLFQPLACLAVLFIAHYDGTLGRKAKYFFYAVYPAQFFVIYLILRFLRP